MPSVEEVECRGITAHITPDQALVAFFRGTVHRCSRAVHKRIIAANVTVLVLPPSQARLLCGIRRRPGAANRAIVHLVVGPSNTQIPASTWGSRLPISQAERISLDDSGL